MSFSGSAPTLLPTVTLESGLFYYVERNAVACADLNADELDDIVVGGTWDATWRPNGRWSLRYLGSDVSIRGWSTSLLYRTPLFPPPPPPHTRWAAHD